MATTNGSGASAAVYISPLNFDAKTPNAAPKCQWERTPLVDQKCPHTTKIEWQKADHILPDILKTVGNTPLVKLRSIPQAEGIQCDILVKCEFFNPGGSIKDRIAFRMIEDAEAAGLLKPGYTIIEPTSGNTGIGLALGAAVKGYRCIIVMSEKMSNEKVNVLKALGAEIVRTPIWADSHAPEGLFGVSYRLRSEIPNSIILDQYSNPGNPMAHYDLTAEEILVQCNGKVDMIVIGTGTGGTITGIGKKFKEKSPQTRIVGVDPQGSILAQPENTTHHHDADPGITAVDFYEVEGIGYDFIPTCLNRTVVDEWLKIDDKSALPMARRLIREEGLLCGGSSGAAMAAALRVARQLPPNAKCVVILPDSIRNYLTKFVSDPWMQARGFLDCPNTNKHSWWFRIVGDLPLTEPLTVTESTTCDRVLDLMRSKNVDQVSVLDMQGYVTSMVTTQRLLTALTNRSVQLNDSVSKAGHTIFPKVYMDSTLGLVASILQHESFVLIVDRDGSKEKPIGIMTAMDVLQQMNANTATAF